LELISFVVVLLIKQCRWTPGVRWALFCIVYLSSIGIIRVYDQAMWAITRSRVCVCLWQLVGRVADWLNCTMLFTRCAVLCVISIYYAMLCVWWPLGFCSDSLVKVVDNTRGTCWLIMNDHYLMRALLNEPGNINLRPCGQVDVTPGSRSPVVVVGHCVLHRNRRLVVESIYNKMSCR